MNTPTECNHPLYEPYEPPDCPYPPSQFTAEKDGRVTIDQWYPRQIVSPEVLGYSAGSELVETRITFKCANGQAVYKVIGMAQGGRNLVCEQVEAIIEHAAR